MAKGGGSQLAQLKSKLHAAGVGDRRQQSKKSRQRRGGQDEKEAAAARRTKINTITAALNPFDEKVTKPKHDVLGRKVKGAVGRPGAAKASGLAQRRATLLPEWQARNKSGSFIDRRFGENDTNLTPEERMLERFTAEKQRRASKGAMFNLNDGDDEMLTHYGQSLSGLDDLADIRLPDEDDEGNMDATDHFGGFNEDGDDQDPDRQKTKAEVMREVMAKSKFHKLERQKMRDEDDELRMQLDDDLGGIRDLLFAQPAKPQEAAPAEAAERSASRLPSLDNDKGKGRATDEAETETSEDKRPLVDPKVASNSYDAFVKELAFERRAKPQDRLKSEAEMAAEEAQRLMKAERARLKRMRADSDDEGADSDDAEGGGGKRRKRGDKKKRKARPSGADDLDDDFELDGVTAGEAYGLGKGLGAADHEDDDDDDDDEEEEGGSEGSEASEEDEAGDGDEEPGDDVEGEEDEDEDDFADLADIDGLADVGEDEESEEEGDHEALTGSAASSSKKGGKNGSKQQNKRAAMTKEEASKLPFTFPCPSTHSELLEILEEHNIEPKFVPTVVKRIRTLYHSSLHEDNKHKLQAFVGVLLDHALHSAAVAGANPEDKIAVALVNALIPQIFSMTQAYPLASSQHFVSKLALMQRNLSRGLAKGALSADARTWPTLPELTLLRIAGTIWPTSDRQHPVATPLALLIAQYLAHARIRGVTDLTSGLFLCALVASHERDSRRVFPEALNFLFNCLGVLSPMDATGRQAFKRTAEDYGIPTPDVGAPHTASLPLHAEGNGGDAAAIVEGPVDLLELLSASSSVELNAASAKTKLYGLCLELVEEFMRLYNGSTAFVEMFQPFIELASGVETDALPPWVQTKLEGFRKQVERQVRLAGSSRRYLRLQAHRAIAIASYVPKFDQQGFNPERKGGFDPDTERAQAAKLRALIKKERKGAIRELRKDNQFLAEERRKEQAAEDEGYQKKMKRIMSTLQDERSEQKQMERQKASLKKRAGRK